ncbi:2-succinyl-6-hydroxy-2,4-cyclohexadiene-1-carboxylate synthase [compost metagenome]
MLTETLTLNGRNWTLQTAGEPGEPVMLLLHGFTGSGRNWEELSKKLPGWRILAPDLPGHGGTDAPTGTMPEVAKDLAALLDAEGVEQALVVGYSMGGRLALHLAATAPERVRGLVVIGATPGMSDADARAARVEADEALAKQIEMDYEGFVRDWEANPLFATQRAMASESQDRIRAIRRSHAPKALAAALRLMGTGAQPPLHERLSAFELPILWVVGEYDAKFRAIAQDVQPLMPAARFAVLPYAGHAVYLERPSAFKTLLLSFAEKLPASDSPRRSDA